MVHLRIVAPHDRAEQALELLKGCETVTNIVFLPGAAQEPEGDVLLCDVAREDASIVVGDLRELDIPAEGSIALEQIDSAISKVADDADAAAAGTPSGGVVWEEVEARTSEETDLSGSYLAFMVIACLIAAVGIITDQVVLIVGAMVVGPEFGPIAGFCVALVQRRPQLAARSFAALAVGFPLAITGAFLAALAFKALGVTPDGFDLNDNSLTDLISSPDFFTFFIAFVAGIAGVLSLTSAKSGALIGVVISVTTIPAAAGIGVALAYTDWAVWRGAQELLIINLCSILVAGTLTLTIQKAIYLRRRAAHVDLAMRERAGLPVGTSLNQVRRDRRAEARRG